MNVGFTGTRRGMTQAQQDAFARLVKDLGEFGSFHHGDCVGADDQAASIVYNLLIREKSLRKWSICCHPARFAVLRAFNKYSTTVCETKAYVARNRDIVDQTEMLVATPWQSERPAPMTGGGTWHTIEYAERRGKDVVIIWPDGTGTKTWPVEEESKRGAK